MTGKLCVFNNLAPGLSFKKFSCNCFRYFLHAIYVRTALFLSCDRLRPHFQTSGGLQADSCRILSSSVYVIPQKYGSLLYKNRWTFDDLLSNLDVNARPIGYFGDDFIRCLTYQNRVFRFCTGDRRVPGKHLAQKYWIS